MAVFNSIADVWAYLDGIPKFQYQGAPSLNLDLRNIRNCCAALDNPHLKYPVIHVTGTNGKGTTCYMLEQVYGRAGYKTGLFTSPHLLRYNERVRINKEEIGDDEILDFFRRYEPLLAAHKLTYFEIATALAFYSFRQHRVDVAIVEVGLGGRLDSTNIVEPLLTVITGIGLDHQDVLGQTEAEIAREKAGIIKPGVPVVLGNISAECEGVICAIAGNNNAEVISSKQVRPDWHAGWFESQQPSVKFKTQLIESVNKWNIAVVLLSVRALNASFPVDGATVVQALSDFGGAPARFEKLVVNRDWYYCGAHNAQALASVVDSLDYFGARKAVLIFSMMKDKVSMESMKLLFTFDERYFFQQSGERAATLELIRSKLDVKSITEENYRTILAALETELVIITGSFYFYPVIKRWIKESTQ